MMKSVFMIVVATAGMLASAGGASLCFVPHGKGTGEARAWAFEFGVATITNNNIEDFTFTRDRVERGTGPAAGEIYAFTASRRIGELQWEIFGKTFTPQLELPFTIDIVDENSRSPFFDAAASFTVRWIDFPWNEYLETSFAMGIGLSYSQKIYLMDIQRHPDDDGRSKLKFNWPIQMTFAHPDHPQHQLMIFIQHHSGGHVFDHGGVNHLGIGYRHGF